MQGLLDQPRVQILGLRHVEIAQLLSQDLLHGRCLTGRRLDEEIAVADRRRIVAVQIVIAHEQIALEDAVFQQSGHLKRELADRGHPGWSTSRRARSRD